MTVEEALAIVKKYLEPRRLNQIQATVFRQSWQGQTYQEMADNLGYDHGYVRDVGSELWQLLSKAFGIQVTKKSLSYVLTQQLGSLGAAKLQQLPPASHLVASAQGNANQRLDWGEAVDVSVFFGRTTELAKLRQWIVKDRCQLVALSGMGGIGKTALTVCAAQQIQQEFEYLIWRSLRNAPPVSDILVELLQFLSNKQEANLPATIDAQMLRLLEHLRSHRCLLLLDNVESILRSGEYAGCYREGYEGYAQIFKRIGEMSHKSCLVLTSREQLSGITAQRDTLPIRFLQLTALDETDAQEILTWKGLSGTVDDRRKLIECYRGNPLALKIVATSIQLLFAGNIPEFLAQDTAVFNGIFKLLEQQLSRLTSTETQIMYWLALNREPVTPLELQADILPQVTKTKLLGALESLCMRSLVERGLTGFTQQPVVMEYITEQLSELLYEELLTEEVGLLTNYALLKAQAKDCVRQSQIRVILKPLATRLRTQFRIEPDIENKLKRILVKLRCHHGRGTSSMAGGETAYSVSYGYGAGNILNLLHQLGVNLAGYDFSDLTVWQAYLQDMHLHDVNFTHADLAKSVFNQAFTGMLAAAFSPDSELLATGDTDGNIHLWQVADSKQLWSYKGHTGWAASVSFSPDGHILASGGLDPTIKLWDVVTGQCLKTLYGHTNSTWSVAFSPDGQSLASGSADQTVKLWDVKTGQCYQTLQGHSNWVVSVAFSPVTTNRYSDQASSPADKYVLASGGFDRTVKLWDANTGECFKTLHEHTNNIWSVAFSPDGRTLASGSTDQTIKLWDVPNGTCYKTLHGHSDMVMSVAFNPVRGTAVQEQGQLLASGSADHTIKLWDIKTGACLETLRGYSSQIDSVAFSPNGQLLASSSIDHTIRLWNPHNGQCLKTLRGHSNSVFAVSFSPDGQTLASANEDKMVRLWDIFSEKCLNLSGHTRQVRCLTFSPQGNTLASGSDDATTRGCYALLRKARMEEWNEEHIPVT